MWFRSIVGSFKSPLGSKPSRSKRRRQNQRRAADRLQLEALESRCLLAFMAPVNYPAGPHVSSVAAGDFANSGVQDLVAVNGGGYGASNNSSSASILMGNGDGSFRPAMPFATGNDPVSVAVGDLTSDGKLDIVTANDGTSGQTYSLGYYQYGYIPPVPPSISVLMGNGDGTFQAPLNFTLPQVQDPGTTASVPQYPLSIAVGDMNHDGHPDLVVATSSAPIFGGFGWTYVDVLLGHGDGSFTTASTTRISNNRGPQFTGAQHIALADFSGDGNLDVAVPWDGSIYVDVLRGNGDGTLTTPSTSTRFPTGNNGAISLTAGDINGDGKQDLITANNGDSFSVLLGNGDGTFQAPITSLLNGVSPPGYSGATPLPLTQQPTGIVTGDLNHDGRMDLAITAFSSYSKYTGSGYYGKYYQNVIDDNVNVLLGNGDGTFADTQTVPLGSGGTSGAGSGGTSGTTVAANFNSDAFPDLAAPGGNGVSVLLNGGNWSTAPQASALTISGFPSSTTAGTPGTFTVTALNADGTVDTSYTGTVRFSSSDGQSLLPAAYTFTAADAGTHTFNATLKTAGTQSITATDTSSGTLTASENGITVTPAAVSKFWINAPSTTAGNAFSITVTALDPYNNTVTGYAGTLHFTSSDRQASLPSDYTFTAADAGVHTFTGGVTLRTAGGQTLTATDTSTSVTSSMTVDVSPAAANTMIVSGFASSMTAGASGNFTVTLKDAYGNVAWGYTGTVHFTSSDAKAVLPANYTFTGADAGKHTFSATLKTAGTQSITATDTLNANLHGTDSGITVKPAAASTFVLSAPSSVTPGQAFSLTVTVEDAYGNIVTGYVGTVHFTSSDSTAHLPANYTFTAGDNGVHTFTALVLKKAGNQTITVTDTHNSPIKGSTVIDVLTSATVVKKSERTVHGR